MTSLKFYGGLGEIGGNKILLEDGETRFFLDFGMSFGQKGMYYEEFINPRTHNGARDLLRLGLLPKLDGIYRQDYLKLDGIEDVILPSTPKDYWISSLKSYQEYTKENGASFLHGVIISHAHADHFQYISFLDPEIPIYCSEITKCLIEATYNLSTSGFENETLIWKNKSLGQLGASAYFPGALKINSGRPQDRNFITFTDNETIRINNTSIKTFPLDHSVPGATAFLIETSDGKSVVYTGDIRFHGRYQKRSENFRDAISEIRPDVLIIEGTRINESTIDAESQVEEDIQNAVLDCPSLVMVGFAWKDTTRFLTLMKVAKTTGRTLVISSKLAYTLNWLRTYGMTDIPDIYEPESVVRVYLKRKSSMLYSKGDYVLSKYDAGYNTHWDKKVPTSIDLTHYDRGIKAFEIRKKPEDYILHLSYYELNELIDLEPQDDCIYIRASSEPFDEEMELDEQRMIHWFTKFSVKFKNKDYPDQFHASGHFSGPEISDFIEKTNPRVIYPIHTENPEAFLALSDRTRLPEYGKKYDVD